MSKACDLNLYLPWEPFNFRNIISKESQTSNNILHYQRKVLQNLVFFEIMHLETCGQVGCNICSLDLILQGWDFNLRGALQWFGDISFLHMRRLIPDQGFSVTKYFMPTIKASHPINIVNKIISHWTSSTHDKKIKSKLGSPSSSATATHNNNTDKQFQVFLWMPPKANFTN